MKKRILALALAASMLVAAAGCTKPAPTPSSSGTSVPTPTAAAKYTAGTYTASAQGYGGLVTAEVSVDANNVTDVKLTGAQETEAIGGAALADLAASAKTANGAEFDGVSGATVTSGAAKDAVAQALAQAKGEAPVGGGAPKDGKYTVDVIGHEGKIVVSTMIVGGKITKVEIPSNNETVGVGTYAVDRIPAAILAAQSVNVDAVTGATITSSAIKQGVAEAIKLSGGNVADYSADVSVPVEKKTVEENVDVVIMGAGTSGIFAALNLLEQGVENVVLFEKADIPGGSFPLTYGGFPGCDSEVFDAWALGRTNSYSSWEKTLYPFLNGYIGDKAPDPTLPWLHQLYSTTGMLYDYMSNIGVGFMSMGTRGAVYPVFAPGVYEGGAGYAMITLVDRLERLGGRIIYGTPVTDLVQDASGRITGLKAEGKDGTSWTVTADAVLLASGSFAKNQDMLDEYFPEWASFYFNAPETLTGDGITLGMKYGAGLEFMGAHMPGFLSTYDSHFELAFMHYTTPGTIVNINGDQFGNIVKSNHSMMAAAKSDPANGDTFYYIFDEAAAASTRNYSQNYGFDTYEGIFEKGEAVHYATVAEAASALNLPNLQATIDTNNALALQGPEAADEWGRTNLPYIDTATGLWLVRVDPNPYLTTGGLSVDLDAHVLTPEGQIIPGLYAAGDVIGSYEQRDGQTYGNGFVAAVAFGWIAGESMMSQVK